MTKIDERETHFLSHFALQTLVDALIELGYDVIGPKIEQNAIVYRSIRDVHSLPQGWTDRQEPAVYRIEQGPHKRRFQFNSSPDSWKRFFFPAASEIGTATLTEGGWKFETPSESTPRFALLGVRACDLAAISVQDRVFRDNQYVDAAYRKRREAAFIVAVNCSTVCAKNQLPPGRRIMAAPYGVPALACWRVAPSRPSATASVILR